MSKTSRQLDTDRALRNRARQRLDSRLSQVRQDMAPAAISSRISEQIKQRSRKTMGNAVELANGNRAVLAGTAAALGVWILRKPIMSWLGRNLLHEDKAEESDDE